MAASNGATGTYTLSVREIACTLNTGDIWCGVVTVGELRPTADALVGHGFADGAGLSAGSLAGNPDDTMFSVGDNDYTISAAYIQVPTGATLTGTLFVLLSADLTDDDQAGLVLTDDDTTTTFEFSGATKGSTGLYSWDLSGLTWSAGDTVTVRLSGPPPDDFSADTNTTGQVDVGGGSVTGNIESGDDVDWFLVELEAGTRYQIDLEGADTGRGTLVDPAIPFLLTAIGDTISDSGGSDIGVGKNDRTIYTPSMSDTYYVYVSSATTATGTYTLSVIVLGANGVSEADTDFPATTATTGRVEVGASATGYMDRGSDFDWFRVDLEAGKTYQFDLEGSPTGRGSLGDPLLQIFDASGSNKLAEDDDGGTDPNAQIVYTATATGAHYLTAQTLTTSTGTYTLSVRDITQADNNAPVFSPTSTTREVAENSAAGTNVGAVIPAATDADSGDTLTYSMAGTDAASFAFDASTRQITTITGVTYNYEAAQNSYSVTVKASDGTDSGELAVTINLTDVAEKSAKPDKPTLAAVAGSSTSLTATWTKPDLDGGPEIITYRVEYREGTAGNWTPAYSGPSLTTTVTGLTASTSYQVKVQTNNGDALSDWSDPSDAVSTNAANTALSGIEVNGTSIPGFLADDDAPQYGVSAATTAAAIVATAEAASATVSYSGTDADTSTAEVHDVSLADGANSVTITVTDGGESDTYTLGVNRAVTADYGWKADSDFDTLKLAGNEHPRGIWSDGAATVYVSDYNDDVVYAYNTDGTRDSSKDITVGEYPNGIWSDGATLWVADSGADKLLAYTLASGARDADEDFDTLDAADNESPRGVFSDGTTMWVADSDEDKIYAYKMSDKSRDADEDFDTLDAAGNNAPRDIWSDGTTMWVADSDDGKIYAYKMSDKSRDADKDFETLNAAGNDSPRALWSHGSVLWASDDDDDKLYAYNLPAAAPIIVSVAVTSMPALDTDTYGAGETIEVSVTFSEAVTATSDTDFVLSVSGAKRAPLLSGSGTATLVFGYTVVSSDADDNGIWIGDQDRTLVGNRNGEPQSGTITSVATSIAADLSHAELGQQSGHKVDGSRTTGNNAPSFTSSATFDAAENQTTAGTVVAADSDSDDSVTGYAITGGADQALFEIGATTGELTFKSAPNFEDPQDSGTDNGYEVTVQATSGTGTREMTADQTITVTVTDVNEKSAKPDKPTLAQVAGSSTSLTATWTKPDLNGGPEINTYRVQYRESTASNWTPAYNGSSLTTTVTGLTASTSYQVQVRTHNGEALSDWSDPSDAVSTNAEMTTPSCTLNTGDLWCGVVTVGRGTDGFGYNDFPTPVVGALSDNDFDVGANSYTIRVILVGSSTAVTPGALNVTLAAALSDADRAKLVLHVGGAEFKLSEATVSGGRSYRWADAGLDWSSESTVTLRLREADNNAPEFATDLAIFTLPENSAADTVVGTVTATDDDDDTLTYSLEGTDAGSFDIDSATGQIKTKANVDYNYEAKFDYEMTAKADDGNGGSDTIDVAILLLDDDTEKSGKPAKPTLAAVPGSSTSLAASWSRPDLNGGPDIAGYDLEYRQTGGSWTNFAHSGTTLTATVTGLTANTEYQVRVQAKNGEGDSDWSDPSDAARTNAVDIPIPPGLEVTLHLSDDELLEDSGRSTLVTATVSPASPVAFTVTISATPVAPASGDDFELSNNRVLRFVADATESTGTVTIRPVDDGDPEPHDVVTVSGAVSNAAIPDPDDVTLTIRNDDADLPQDVAIDAPAAVEEDAGTAAVTVTITTRQNSAPTIDVDLYYRWQEGTATRGEDYTAPPGQVFKDGVLFATVPASAFSPNAAGTAWVTERSFTIGIINDREADRDETIAFYVTTGTYRSAKHTITIRDDDTPVLRNVRLVSGPGSDGVWRTGEWVDVEVRYSLPVVVERPDCWPLSAYGTCWPPGPYMVVAFSSHARPGHGKWLSAQLARYVGGSRTDTLRFAYQVGDKEDGALGVVVADNGMSLRGATIRPSGGGDAELSEYTNTRVRQVDVVRPGGGEWEWTAGDTVRVKVRFAGPVQYTPPDEPQNRDDVFVDERRGTPTIRLRLGEAPNPGLPRTARYESGSGTDTLTFAYAVTAGDGRVSAVEAVADSLARNGATIRNEDGYDAELNHVDVLWYSWLALRVRHATAREGGTLRFTLELARASQAPVTVDYETADGTATAGQDYTAKRGTVTFAPGRTRRTVEVPVLRDGKVEGVETMVLRLSNARSEGSEVPMEMKVSEAQGAIENVASEVNTPATGVPTINGTAQVGETLTAGTSGIADQNGLENATFSYQWFADHAKIAGANSSTRTLTDVDQGKAIKVRVSFTDDAGHWETLTSAATEPVTSASTEPVFGDGLPGAPRNLTATAGDQEVTLSWEPPADNGNAPATRYRIEWRIDGKDYKKGHWGPSGETTYTKTDLANGVKYIFRVKAENGNGNSYGPYGPASEEVSATPTSGSAVDLGTPVLSNTKTLHHGMVKLDWEDVEDAGWYVVQYYHVKGGEWLDLPAAGVDIAFHGSSAVVSNLHGLSWVRVRAASCAGESEWSQIEELYGTNASDWEGVPVPEVEEGDEIEPCPVVLGTPVLSNTETLHHGMVRLDWKDIEDAGWYVVQYYHVKSGEWLDLPAEGVDIAFHGSSAVVSNLHGLSWLRVRAMSCAGASEWSQIEELYGTNASDWEGVPVPEVAEGDEIEPCSEDADTPDNSPATGAPTISGTAQVGETLSADKSGIADADGLKNATFSYQWLADNAAIAGATGSTYTLADSDEGKAITVQVSFTDDAGNNEALTSAATDAVDARPNSLATGAPTISGTAQVGKTLTANTSGIADADGLTNVAFSYQWLSDDTAIQGATGLTYTLEEADEGKAIKVQVSFSDDGGNDETLTSTTTDAVAAAPAANNPATGAPTISGTAQVGETLSAYTSEIVDADGLSNVQYEYQWLADDTAIAGATALTYTLVAADEGKAIKVRVSFTDDAGHDETLTSAATAAVAGAQPTELPAKPTGLSATASHDSVTLTWDDPGDDSITGYVILRRVRENDVGGEFSVLVPDTGSAATTYTDDTVVAGITYTYRIKAVNGAGTSERSHWFHIDTPAAPVPDKPTGLSATASHDAIALTWEDPGDDSITGYVILRRLPRGRSGGPVR